MRAAPLLALTLAALAAGCSQPTYHTGHLQCGPHGACPSGFTCLPDNHCWLPGTGPNVDLGMKGSLCGASQALLCDGFEAAALNAQWNPAVLAGHGSVTIDTTRAFRGSSSLHVHTDAVGNGLSPYANVTETRTLPQSTTIYVRLWAFFASPFPPAFNQLINLLDANTGGIAYVTRDGIPVLNAYTAPITYHESSTPLPIDRWTCIRFSVDQGTTSGDVHLYLDDSELLDAVGHNVTITEMRRAQFGLDIIGDTGSPAADLWLDELMVDNKPIACSD